MKTLSKMISFCAVLAASGVSLAGDCNSQNGSAGTVVAASPQRYAYRSGYSSVQTTAPVTAYTSAPSVYSMTRPIHGPESHWDFMRARQHVRGW